MVPCIAIKTGTALKFSMSVESAASFMMPAGLAQSGTPVLCLDVRPRKPLLVATTSSRAEMIEDGKAQLNAWCDELLKMGAAESLDVCSLAFLHEVLTTGRPVLSTGKADAIPLHEAIRRAREGGTDVVDGKATSKQIAEVADWLAHRTFSDAWQVLDDREQREARGENYRGFFKAPLFAHSTYLRTLLSSPNLHHANLEDMDGLRRVVNVLVRLDRLPPCNPLEGLLLLRSAWRDYDVAMLFADRYKRANKVIFALQLILGWLVVYGAVMSKDANFSADVSSGFTHAVFAVSVVISLLVSLDGQLNPKSRWRQLRHGASALQSIIWLYRTRVEPFELDESQRLGTQPENELCACLTAWRENVSAGAGLASTSLKQEHPASVYRHFQDKGTVAAGSDDFHSPTNPSDYIIRLRIQPMLAFYQRRLPSYTRRNTILKVLILLLGVVASVLARYDELDWVAVVTASAGMVTSWSEFSDITSKVERYSRSIIALENLLTWWDSLGEVQKASKESIRKLVCTAESVMTQEQLSWTSTGSKQSAKDAKNAETQNAVTVEVDRANQVRDKHSKG